MNQEKILLCIQEHSSAKDLESKLVNEGYSVKVSNPDSTSLLTISSKVKPDLLIVSVNLESDYSGIDAAAKIKNDFDIPIIFISFIEDNKAYKKAREINPIGYFSLPFYVGNILRAVELGLLNYNLQRKIINDRKKFDEIIKAGRAGVYEIDPVTFEIDLEESLAKVFGYTVQEVKDKGWGNLLPIEDFNNKRALIADLLNGKTQSYLIDIRIIKNDGTIAWAASNGSLVTDEKNRTKIVGTLTDITERKTAEEKLKKYSEDLQKINSDKDKFFSIISHDLRNPFNSLLGFSELLANNIEDLTEQEVKDSAKTIHRTATNLFNLLTNLLEWSRLQTGNFAFEKTEFSLDTIINHILSFFSDSFEAKNLNLIKETNCKINITADQNMIEACIRNLVSNAIKFTREGGTVTVGCKANGSKAEIYIKDTGVGIATEDQKKLFRIEKQFTTEGTNQEKGTGLGLLLAKEYVDKNDGTISMKSQLNKGTTFTITLPYQNY